MNGWFELQRSSDDQFHFVLKAGNAEVILGSERYTTRAAAENGIASVRANCADDARYERHADDAITINGAQVYDIRENKAVSTAEIPLETALRDYDGALVLVSHDPDFLRAVGVTRTIAL